ncbi:hypothetical protein IKQ26_00895 [bacterium]|nr:hypothetical protein [bacterium]
MALYKKIYGLIFILLFFSQFVIVIIPGTGAGNIAVGLIGVLLFYLFLICSNYKKFLVFVKDLIKIPIIKVFFIYIIYVTVSMIIHKFLGHYKAPSYFYWARIYRFYIYSIPIFFFPALGLFCNIKLTHFVKWLYTLFIIVFITGIIQYLGLILNIGFIDTIISFFTNARATLYIDGGESVKSLLRVFSIFNEPSGFGQFIFIFMPIITTLSVSKYKIFKNNLVNNISKKTMLFLMFINLILTKSPIYLVLCTIEALILFTIINYHTIKKHFVRICIICIISVLIIPIIYSSFQNQIEQSYLGRIINTIQNLTNFQSFVLAESSLATRIVNYSIQLVSLKYNLLFGAGLYNIDVFLNDKYLQISPLPFTMENIAFYYNSSFVSATNKSIVWTSLAEFGLVGFFLYVWFIFKLFKSTIKMLKLKIYSCIEQELLFGILGSLITLSVISFYNLGIDSPLLWIIYGLVVAYLYNTKSLNKEILNV